MTHPSNALYAAIYAADFPVQALLRLRPDLHSHPVAILDGAAPQERVCAQNQQAQKRGVATGMTRLEVEELGGIVVLTRSIETERAAKMILLENVSQFSPRIEETFADNAAGFVMDISGSERLFGMPAVVAKRIQLSIVSAGFRASIAVSSHFDTARIKAAFTRGVTVVPHEKEAASLSAVPIEALQLSEDEFATFALWGVRRLGELAELPEEDLITRLGQRAQTWLRLARGTAEHMFVPLQAKFELKEHIEFETHIEQLDSLIFVAATMISNLITRATSRALSLAALTVQMKLEKEPSYQRVVRPAIPSADRKFLLKLLQLEIAAHPPQAAICSLTISADAGHESKVQLGLFAPQTPESSQLDVTLARLKALVGDDRVGSPRLLDTHRSDSFEIDPFRISGHSAVPIDVSVRVSLRRVRPPRQIRLQLRSAKPAFFLYGPDSYGVQAVYGPWISSGNWWSLDQWNRAEWDVVAANHLGETMGCLIVHDQSNKRWFLEATYD